MSALDPRSRPRLFSRVGLLLVNVSLLPALASNQYGQVTQGKPPTAFELCAWLSIGLYAAGASMWFAAHGSRLARIGTWYIIAYGSYLAIMLPNLGRA